MNTNITQYTRYKPRMPITSWGDIGLIVEGAILTGLLLWIAISLHKIGKKTK
jgi:hypothetical protein